MFEMLTAEERRVLTPNHYVNEDMFSPTRVTVLQ